MDRVYEGVERYFYVDFFLWDVRERNFFNDLVYIMC